MEREIAIIAEVIKERFMTYEFYADQVARIIVNRLRVDVIEQFERDYLKDAETHAYEEYE